MALPGWSGQRNSVQDHSSVIAGDSSTPEITHLLDFITANFAGKDLGEASDTSRSLDDHFDDTDLTSPHNEFHAVETLDFGHRPTRPLTTPKSSSKLPISRSFLSTLSSVMLASSMFATSLATPTSKHSKHSKSVNSSSCCSKPSPTATSTNVQTQSHIRLSASTSIGSFSLDFSSIFSAVFQNPMFPASANAASFSATLIEQSASLPTPTSAVSAPSSSTTTSCFIPELTHVIADPTPSSTSEAASTSYNTPRKKAVIGSVIGSAVLILVVGILAWVYIQRRRRAEERALTTFAQVSSLLNRTHTRTSSFGTPPAWSRNDSLSWSSQIAARPSGAAISLPLDPFADERGSFRRGDPPSLLSNHDSFYGETTTKLADPFADPSSLLPYRTGSPYALLHSPIPQLQPAMRRQPETQFAHDRAPSSDSLSQYSNASYEMSRPGFAV